MQLNSSNHINKGYDKETIDQTVKVYGNR